MRVSLVDSYEERCLVNRVVVLGSINRDLMLALDRLPVPGETVTATGMEVFSGGKGANQAVAAAAIGGSVALVGRVGADAAGLEQVSALAAAGVDVTFVEQDPRAPTGTAVVMVDGGGHNSIAVVPGANGLLDAASVEAAAPVIEGARILLLQLEIPAAAVERAVSIARSAGVLTVLNIAPYRDVPRAVLADVDYLLANETEAAALLGDGVKGIEDAARAAGAMRRLGPSWGIITLGAQGTVAAGDEGWIHEPAPSVEAVDTTGAGDVFAGVLAVGLVESMPVRAAIRLAITAASLSVTRRGARGLLPADAPAVRELASHLPSGPEWAKA
jgi:ribokinase